MSDGNATELLPCPFCGGEAELRHNMAWDYEVRCTRCRAKTRLHHDNHVGAVDDWNTRAERTCRNIHEYRDENGVLHRDARIFKCSECGFKADDFYGDDEESFPRFCPNCGARVEVGA